MGMPTQKTQRRTLFCFLSTVRKLVWLYSASMRCLKTSIAELVPGFGSSPLPFSGYDLQGPQSQRDSIRWELNLNAWDLDIDLLVRFQL
jgi:hypothetical protein